MALHRVGKRIGFQPGPPDKTLLKIGDKLAVSFPVDINIEWSGNSVSEFDFKELLKNQTNNFALKAKETYSYTDVGGFIITYKSPKGAPIYYNADRIITQIEGDVFERQHNVR